MKNMKKYIISEKELERLIQRDWELLRLENNGVDNWSGYDYEEEIDEEDDITVEDYIKDNFKEAQNE